jgi:hypothetical protein
VTDRDRILARRARYVAAALASLAGAQSCDSCEPKACLSIAEPAPDGGTTPRVCLTVAPPEPRVCLSPIPNPPDAGSDAGAPEAGASAPPPKTPPKPKVCLSVDPGGQ